MRRPVLRDPSDLSALLEVSQTLGSTLEPARGPHPRAGDAGRAPRRPSGSVVLPRRGHGRAGGGGVASGVAAAQARKARYRLGEGITGRVVAERQAGGGAPGQPGAAVPEPHRRLDGVEEASSASSACRSPLDAQTVGALGVTLPYQKDRAYDQEVKFFGIVGSMIGQALRVHRLVEAERQRLLRGEHAAAPGAARALRHPQHRRHQPAHAAGVRAGRAGGAAPTPPCSSAASPAPARSWSRTPSTTTRRGRASPSSR